MLYIGHLIILDGKNIKKKSVFEDTVHKKGQPLARNPARTRQWRQQPTQVRGEYPQKKPQEARHPHRPHPPPPSPGNSGCVKGWSGRYPCKLSQNGGRRVRRLRTLLPKLSSLRYRTPAASTLGHSSGPSQVAPLASGRCLSATSPMPLAPHACALLERNFPPTEPPGPGIKKVATQPPPASSCFLPWNLERRVRVWGGGGGLGYHIQEEGLHGSRGGRPAEGGCAKKDA